MTKSIYLYFLRSLKIIIFFLFTINNSSSQIVNIESQPLAKVGVKEIPNQKHPSFSEETKVANNIVIPRDQNGKVLGRLRIKTTVKWKDLGEIQGICKQSSDEYLIFKVRRVGARYLSNFVKKFAPLLQIDLTEENLHGERFQRRLNQIVYDFRKKYLETFKEITHFNIESHKEGQFQTIFAKVDKCSYRLLKIYQRVTTYHIIFEHPHIEDWEETVDNFDDVFHFDQKVINDPNCCPIEAIEVPLEQMKLKSDGPVEVLPRDREMGNNNNNNNNNDDGGEKDDGGENISSDPSHDEEESSYFYPNGFPNQLNYTVTGKGKTTEHIMDMTMHNPTDNPISYTGSKVIITSVDSSQFYMAIIPPFTVPPHGTITIPVDGDCGTIYQPPLGDGQISSPVSTWHTPQSAGEPPNPGDDLPDDLYTPIEVSQGDIVATFPGTDVPLGASTKLEENPALLFELDETINTTVERLWEEDRINVPIPKTRAFREVRQQAKWMIFSIYEGNPYTKEDMIGRLAEQVKDQTGMEVEELPEPVQEQFTSGSTNIWETLTVIGEESKLLKVSPEDIPLPGESTEEIPIKHESKCSGDVKQNCNPASCFDFEMNIDNDWNDAEERAKVIKKVKDNVSQKADITQDEVWKEYDLSDNPTSAAAFWKPGNVGGFASAYAKTLFKTRNGWSYTGTTEKLSADAEGTSNLTMTITPGDGCKAFVVGVSKASILASSTAFDAMLGNTFGEDDKDQLAVLKFIKASGKLAVKYLIDRKTGGTKDDFGTYAKDAIKDHFKGKLKEATVDKLQEYLEDKLDNLLSELGLSSISEFLEKGITDLGSLLEEHLGFNPFKLAEELGEKIDEGLEAAFNLAFVSDTYATANGFLVITVGKKTDSAKVHTRITYSRQGTESTSEAMKGTGPNCDELFLSDVQPNSLTITTKGRAELTAQAFGNGKASSYLESQQLQVLLGVCDCGDEVNGSLNYEFMLNHQWYLDDKTQSTSDVGPAIEKELLKQIEAKRKDGTLKNGTSMEEWRKFLEDELKKITLNQVVLKPECPKSQD